MHPRTLTLTAAVGLLAACAKQVPVPTTVAAAASTKPRSVRLLPNTPERETASLEGRREDVEVDTREGERNPRIVATAETQPLMLDGAKARLCGDEACTQGFAVDNFLLLEVLDAKGKVSRRAAVGFTDSVFIGNEQVDNLGRHAFSFEPNEVDITGLLPESEPFRIRATALDFWGVGRVTAIYLRLEPGAGRNEDDLRGQ
ncbi:hypothetical protein D7Y13_33860 [Corallococcus praedator]|uniref:Lipoprotein n=1 Tax=Corallococcus praedator TaxID=2316724 RepID=A0ABX9Q8S8_9BACT|nr:MULTISPECIES: hypothetical protein [Corallococcus]RKH21117.1 hypothetical protein D7X75_37250 [Corallococcus sp. CA031C]RKH93933.1 hypothetical protein D7Y13_33860 [Corallococcus praedator]